MAEADDTKEQKEKKEPEAEKNDKKSLIGRFLPWIIMVAMVAFCAGSGFGLGRLFARSRTPKTSESGSKPDASTRENGFEADDNSAKDSQNVWYYDLDPVVANLDETGVTRYVRASLTLEISSEMGKKKGVAFLKEKKPILTNWLTIYFASLSLEDIRGDINLKRIQSKLLDDFNGKLFPNSKPKIKHILFREFAIQ